MPTSKLETPSGCQARLMVHVILLFALLFPAINSSAQLLPKEAEPSPRPTNKTVTKAKTAAPAPSPKVADSAKTTGAPRSGWAAMEHEGNFSSWGYGQDGVYGINRVASVDSRDYYKITKTGEESYEILHFNFSGIQTSNVYIRYSKGKLNSYSSANRWNLVWQTLDFTPQGNDEFIVVKKVYGSNPLAPCKADRYIYRDHQLTEVRHLSANGTIMNNESGVAIVKYERSNNITSFGLATRESYYDADGNPVVMKGQGYQGVSYQYDNSGNLQQKTFFDKDNLPVKDNHGIAKYTDQYDADDHVVLEETFGLNGERVADETGVAKKTYEYKDGWISKLTRYNDRNEIAKTASNGDGAAIIRYTHDRNGNLLKMEYLDENGQFVNNNNGIAKILYSYNALNQETATDFYDANQLPTTNRVKVHRYVYAYDEKGQMTEESYYDISNNPMLDYYNQTNMSKFTHDEYGRKISESFWKDENNKMNRWDGYHMVFYKYDDDGHTTEEMYYDQNNQLTKVADGYSRRAYVYNDKGRNIALAYFDGAAPVEIKQASIANYHRITYSYNDQGKIVSLEYFSASGNPVNASISIDNNFTCHKIEFIYKGYRIIQEQCYQVNSDIPVKIIDCLTNDYVGINGIGPVIVK